MVLSPEELWAKLQEVNDEAGRDMSVVTPNVKEAIMKNIKRRLTPQPLKIRADLEMTCFRHGGVEHIKVCPIVQVRVVHVQLLQPYFSTYAFRFACDALMHLPGYVRSGLFKVQCIDRSTSGHVKVHVLIVTLLADRHARSRGSQY